MLLLPVLYIRGMAGIGYFSIVILFFTFIAIGIILGICFKILSMEASEVRETYNLDLEDDDRDYIKFDGFMVPVFAATMMCSFEGNQ